MNQSLGARNICYIYTPFLGTLSCRFFLAQPKSNVFIDFTIYLPGFSIKPPEILLKDYLFEGISTVADRRTESRRGHVRYDHIFARCTV